MRRITICLLAMIMTVGVFAGDDMDKTSDDYKAVYNAVLDYVEGVYNVQPERIERSVSPNMVKVGYAKRRGDDWMEIPMTFEQLHKLAGEWNKGGKRAND